MKAQRITLEEAFPGLRLAKPVTGPTGIVVLGTGAELTEALIERLKNMGVPAVTVEPDSGLVSCPTKSIEELEGELLRRFTYAGADPTLCRIREAIRAQLRASRWGEMAQ